MYYIKKLVFLKNIIFELFLVIFTDSDSDPDICG